MADIRAFFMGGAKKKQEKKEEKQEGCEGRSEKGAPRSPTKAAKRSEPQDDVVEIVDAEAGCKAGAKRSEKAESSDARDSPAKRPRAAKSNSPAPGAAVVQSKFFADSPTKAAAAKKRKEQEAVEVISTDSDDFEVKEASKSGKVPKVDELTSPTREPGTKIERKSADTKKESAKSPVKGRVLPSWTGSAKADEKGAKGTPQGKMSSPPTSTPPTKKDSAKSSQKTTTSEEPQKTDDAPEKKKFNPWNQEKAEVPNKHLRDQKIADNRGKQNCLVGMTFVITGVLDSMEREECVDLIKSYGGKVTGGVSGKTTYLITGTDAGESKIKKAQEKGTKQIDEDGLFAIIKASGPPAGPPTAAAGVGGGGSGGAFSVKKTDSTLKKVEPASKVPKQEVGRGAGKMPQDKAGPDENLAASLWVDKYKPSNFDELIGNGKERQTLREWLSKWGGSSGVDDFGMKKGGQVKQDASKFKAVLIHGPPGIGKSSSARVVIENSGYTMIELNASDVRNKAGLKEKVASLSQNQSINTLLSGQKKGSQTFSGPKGGSCSLCGKNERQHFGGVAQQCFSTFAQGPIAGLCLVCGKDEEHHQGEHKLCYGTCLVMDEVDGMSSGDRGGMAELIQIIKETRVPIICIANDGYHPKVKSLKNHCLELKFSKPMHSSVVKRLKTIAEKEGFDVQNENALEKLYLSSGSDIRHVINAMQTWRMRTSEIKYDEVASEIRHGEKDSSVRQTSPFDIVPQWFLSGSVNKDKSFRDRLDMFFFDTDLVPLFVQENYVKMARVDMTAEENCSKERGEYNLIRRMAEAADNISESDCVNNQIRSKQNWSLLPFYGNLSTISAAFPIRGQPPAGFYNAKQGAWPPPLAFPGKCLGHQSTMGKKGRLVQDVARCMKLNSFANKSEVAMDYLSVMRQRLCSPLLGSDGAKGVDNTLKMMEEYLLSKDELDTICSELRLPDIKVDGKVTEIAPDFYGQVDSKIKAALTRTYNKETHTVKFLKPKAGAEMASKVGKANKSVGRSGEGIKETDDDSDEDGEGEGEEGAEKQAAAATAAKTSKGAGSKTTASTKKPAASKKKK